MRFVQETFSNFIKGCRQAVRHQTLTLVSVGSNPAIPAKKRGTHTGAPFFGRDGRQKKDATCDAFAFNKSRKSGW